MKSKFIIWFVIFLALLPLVYANLIGPHAFDPLSPSSFIFYGIALIFTLILELIVAFSFFHLIKIPFSKKLLYYFILVNFVSFTLVWFVVLSEPLYVLFYFSESVLPLVLVAETFAVVFETFFIYKLIKPTLTLKKVFILSLLMNIASFFPTVFAVAF